MSEMKLCPFCGGIPVLDGRSDDVHVRCETGCQAIGRTFSFNSEDYDAIEKAESDAVEAWNRRTPSAEVSRLTAERDALRTALDTFVRIHRVAGTPNAISDADLVVWTQEAIDAARAALKDAP